MKVIHIAGNLYELSRYDSRSHMAACMYQSGVQAESKGEVHDAQTYYAKAVNADPAFAAAWVNLGTLQCQLGALPRAEFCYRQALAADAEYALARYNLACCLQDQERHEEARTEYERVLHNCPDYFDALFNLAHMHLYHFSRPEKALHFIQKCERLRPKDRNLLVLKRSWAKWHKNMGWQVFQAS